MLIFGFNTSQTMGIAAFPSTNMKIVNFLGGLIIVAEGDAPPSDDDIAEFEH